MIFVVARPIANAAYSTCCHGCSSGRDRTKWEVNITDRVATTGMDYAGDQLILLGMLWLKFLLFHGSSEVWKDVSINGRVGVRTVKGMHQGCRDEGRTKVRHLHQSA